MRKIASVILILIILFSLSACSIDRDLDVSCESELRCEVADNVKFNFKCKGFSLAKKIDIDYDKNLLDLTFVTRNNLEGTISITPKYEGSSTITIKYTDNSGKLFDEKTLSFVAEPTIKIDDSNKNYKIGEPVSFVIRHSTILDGKRYIKFVSNDPAVTCKWGVRYNDSSIPLNITVNNQFESPIEIELLLLEEDKKTTITSEKLTLKPENLIIPEVKVKEDEVQKLSNGLLKTKDSPEERYERYGFYIEGSLKNTSGKNLNYASISYAIFDDEGAQIGTAVDMITNLLEGATWKYSAMFADTNNEACSYKLAQVFAY